MNDTNTTHYCNLEKFSLGYREIHGYLSVLVCIFGSITNVVNIIVLSTPAMRWPVNFILTGLATADLLVMLNYFVFSGHVYLDPNARITASYFSYSWTLYMFFHAMFTQVCHFISCCLTVTLATWRYLAITYPHISKVWCTSYRTKLVIILTYVLCPMVCFPVYLGLETSTLFRDFYPNGTIIPGKDKYYNGTRVNKTLYVLQYNDDYKMVNFWVYSVVIKLVPCVLLMALSMVLFRSLLEAKKRWQKLMSNNDAGSALVENCAKAQKKAEKEQQAVRTNRMLLAVLLLFLMTELPQAILGLLSIVLGDPFEKQCFIPLGDVMDMLALTNSAINFILYCSMSCQFRTTFQEIFRPKFPRKWKSMGSHITEITDTSGNKIQVAQV